MKTIFEVSWWQLSLSAPVTIGYADSFEEAVKLATYAEAQDMSRPLDFSLDPDDENLWNAAGYGGVGYSIQMLPLNTPFASPKPWGKDKANPLYISDGTFEQAYDWFRKLVEAHG